MIVVPSNQAEAHCDRNTLKNVLSSLSLTVWRSIIYTRARPVLVTNMVILASCVKKWIFFYEYFTTSTPTFLA